MPSQAFPQHPKQRIAARCAQELRAGEVVNLGLGIPTLTANYLDADAGVIFHTENGAFGFGDVNYTKIGFIKS